MIRDQRHMTGPARLRTVEEIVAAWKAYARQATFDRDGDPFAVGLVASDTPAVAYVNHSRWVANCPCGGGIAAWVENPRGVCMSCGTVRPIRFPDRWEIVERLLLGRPAVNRNWWPGEPIEFLETENQIMLGV